MPKAPEGFENVNGIVSSAIMQLVRIKAAHLSPPIKKQKILSQALEAWVNSSSLGSGQETTESAKIPQLLLSRPDVNDLIHGFVETVKGLRSLLEETAEREKRLIEALDSAGQNKTKAEKTLMYVLKHGDNIDIQQARTFIKSLRFKYRQFLENADEKTSRESGRAARRA